MKNLLFAAFLLGFSLFSCRDKDPAGPDPSKGVDLTGIPYNPTAINLTIPPGFPAMEIPADNPLTADGIELGRHLFYDPILSKDSTIACASCHKMQYNFTDNAAFSLGVGGQLGTRSSMPLINVGFFTKGLFWDGRSATLEGEALHPVENPVEMAEIWSNVEAKLQRHAAYPEMFRKAFGIENSLDITKTLATKALAQFERTLMSAGSRFDKKVHQGDTNPFLFSDLETDGYKIFFDDLLGGSVAGHCAHCHDGGALLSSERFENNAITAVNSLDDFPDKGLGAISGKQTDNGKFKASSLRNIALTTPYMHDGRFQTLEQVVEHYFSGGHFAPNVVTSSINQRTITPYEKQALLAFLQTLTDTSYYSNPAFSNPF